MTKSTGASGDMTQWTEIGCQRNHIDHYSRVVDVDLARPHIFHDYPQIPDRFARKFRMAIWDWNHPEHAGVGYCPAVDVVSQTIEQVGCWEPCETIVTLAAMTAADPESIFVDFGAQLGWFSLLAASTGHDVIAFEADPDCMAMVRRNAALNGWDDQFGYVTTRVGPRKRQQPFGRHIAMAKIDIEGAEEHAVEMLWGSIDSGEVDHLLIEISPVFNDSYPALVVRLLEAGYEASIMPDKKIPPARFERFPRDLEPTQLWPLSLIQQQVLPSEWLALERVKARVADWHQANVLFSRPGAPI